MGRGFCSEGFKLASCAEGEALGRFASTYSVIRPSGANAFDVQPNAPAKLCQWRYRFQLFLRFELRALYVICGILIPNQLFVLFFLL